MMSLGVGLMNDPETAGIYRFALEEHAPFVKDPAFFEEKEWRLGRVSTI
jgi:hypothetical protein